VTLDVVYVQPGFGERGGVTVDVVNLVDGLRERRHSARTAGSFRQLARELRAPGTSLVHVFGCLPSATTIAAFALARLRRVPLVWTPIFNPIRRHTWSGYGALRVMELFDSVAPRAARLADAVIAATEPEAEYFTGLGSRRVALIPPGVDPALRPATPQALDAFRASHGIGDRPLVLVVGRDNSRKALPFGLEAFARLRALLPTAQLLLVGPDRSFAGGAADGVTCGGWLDPASITLAYQAADVLFVPSLYEGLPRAVIEAWQWSTPVVATDRVGLATAIDGVGGCVVPFGDADAAAKALETVLADVSLARRLGDGGRQLVETGYILPHLVQRTLDVYQAVVRGVA